MDRLNNSLNNHEYIKNKCNSTKIITMITETTSY